MIKKCALTDNVNTVQVIPQLLCCQLMNVLRCKIRSIIIMCNKSFVLDVTVDFYFLSQKREATLF